MAESNWAASKGFGRKRISFRSNLRSGNSLGSWPEMKRPRMPMSWWLIRCQTSVPSMSGRRTSMSARVRSGPHRCASLRASVPVAAVWTRCPIRLRCRARTWRVCGSSSTRSTVVVSRTGATPVPQSSGPVDWGSGDSRGVRPSGGTGAESTEEETIRISFPMSRQEIPGSAVARSGDDIRRRVGHWMQTGRPRSHITHSMPTATERCCHPPSLAGSAGASHIGQTGLLECPPPTRPYSRGGSEAYLSSSIVKGVP